MRVDTIRKLFAGVRIDGRMREQLEKCPTRDRVWFESPDGKYLTVVRGGDDTYIGKILDPAVPLNGIEDVRRNVWSILQRVCPGRRDESEVKLFALDDSEVEPTFSSTSRQRPYPSGGPDRMDSRPSERSFDRLPERDRPLDRMSDRMSDRLPDRGPDRVSDRGSERLGDRGFTERALERAKDPARQSDDDDYY